MTDPGITNPSGVAARVYDERYYGDVSGDPKAVFEHPGLAEIKEISLSCDRVLDCGCGEGAKLAGMGNNNTDRFGIEWSDSGVRLAARRQGHHPTRDHCHSRNFPGHALHGDTPPN